MAIIVALLAPVLAGAAGLGIEVSNWSVEQMRMQRAADAAALAGAITYNADLLQSKPAATAAQDAATAAANLAEINHVPGPNSPNWNASSLTLTDTNLSVQITSGVQSASDKAVQVNVHESVPLTLARLFSSNSSVTIGGSSTAELTGNGSGSSTGPQPCIFAMKTTDQGGTGVTANGYISVTAPGCTLRSNAGIQTNADGSKTYLVGINFSGGGSFNTGGLYTAGTISIPSWVSVSGGEYQKDGIVADPYLSDTTLQTDLQNAATATGGNITCYNQQCGLPSSAGGTFNGSYCSGQGGGSVTCYLKPGNYGNWTALGGGPYSFKLSPGLYVFNGKIDLEDNTTTTGSAVTILVTGTFTGENTFNFNVSAPDSSQAATTGGVTGVVLAGTTSDPTSPARAGVLMSGNPQFVVDGVVYFPNATFDASGSPTIGASNNTCMEFLVGSIKMSGATYVNSNCATVNAIGFGSNPGSTTYTAKLVQ